MKFWYYLNTTKHQQVPTRWRWLYRKMTILLKALLTVMYLTIKFVQFDLHSQVYGLHTSLETLRGCHRDDQYIKMTLLLPLCEMVKCVDDGSMCTGTKYVWRFNRTRYGANVFWFYTTDTKTRHVACFALIGIWYFALFTVNYCIDDTIIKRFSMILVVTLLEMNTNPKCIIFTICSLSDRYHQTDIVQSCLLGPLLLTWFNFK